VATLVILALMFFGVLVSVYPIAPFNTQSVDKSIIPIWEPGDAEQTAEKTEDDDTPIPTLSSSPAQSETSGAIEMDVDPWASEVVEAALREPFAQGPKETDEAAESNDLPRAAFDNPAGRPADPVVLPRVEPLPSESTITSSQDPALTSTAQYPDVAAQPLPPQTSPPDSPVDTETFIQPPAPPDDTTSSPLPADETTPSPLPADEMTPSPLSADSLPLEEEL
jgi:hypothetical protein